MSAMVEALHPSCAPKTVFRSQYAAEDGKKYALKNGEKDPWKDLGLWWKDLPEQYKQVDKDGETYFEFGGVPANKHSAVVIPPMFRVKQDLKVQTLYDKNGKVYHSQKAFERV